MQAYKIDLDGSVFGDGTNRISYQTILETVILGVDGSSTADLIKAAKIYDRLKENSASKTEGKYWWADEADFNFIRRCLDAYKWGNPMSGNPTLTKFEIAKFCQRILESKSEPVPGT